MKAVFSTIYRVDITIPEEVFLRYEETKEYALHALAVSKFVNKSGQNTYGDNEEWAESDTRASINKFVKAWSKKIEQWQRELNTEKLDQ